MARNLCNNVVKLVPEGILDCFVMHNFVGHRFGRLTVNRRVPGGAWECYCDCGVVSYVTTGNLRKGNTQSCGCLWKDKITTHGLTGSPEYVVWKAMHERCRSNHPKTRRNYKDRGISVCEEWSDFTVFLRDMGMKPAPNSDLDRRDNDLGYSKDNCRWISRKQNLNNRRCCHYIEFNGRRQTIAEWADELCINYRTLNNRINRGWTVERALAVRKEA